MLADRLCMEVLPCACIDDYGFSSRSVLHEKKNADTATVKKLSKVSQYVLLGVEYPHCKRFNVLSSNVNSPQLTGVGIHE